MNVLIEIAKYAAVLLCSCCIVVGGVKFFRQRFLGGGRD